MKSEKSTKIMKKLIQRMKLIAFVTLINTINVNAQQNINVTAFSTNDTIGCAPLTVAFTSNTNDVNSYYWDFGNGNTSTLENPTNIYHTDGKYTVIFITQSLSGKIDTTIATNIITVVTNPIADFDIHTTQLCSSDSLKVTNNSKHATQWLWDFGDGTTSSLQTPTHVYTSSGSGNYSVVLVASNDYGCPDVMTKTHKVDISGKPTISFTVDTNQSCDVNKIFHFKSVSNTAINWHWDFGDGTSSTIGNPTHNYASIGTYGVSLTVTDFNGCTATLTKNKYITIFKPSIPTFTSTSTLGCDTQTVLFKNTTHNATSILWHFGDGDSSLLYAPMHSYTDTGYFDVSMTVTDSNNCVSFKNYDSSIVVAFNSPIANFTMQNTYGCAPLTVSFSDLSTNTTSWLWGFGDGTTSILQNPTYTYYESGFHTVILHVYNAYGCKDSLMLSNQIYVANPISKFSPSDTSGCAPLQVAFTDSSLQASQWLWDFGDGDTSTQRNPIHTYRLPRKYTVKLITTNSSGCKDTLIKSNLINAFSPQVEYSVPDTVTGCAPIKASFDGTSLGVNFWQWDFGDGATSSLSKPTHTYYTPGIYSVSLITQIKDGCIIAVNNYNTYVVQGSLSRYQYQLANCPNYEATFTDTSKNAISWSWNFGDGTTSKLQNPVHNYDTMGFYTVSLTTTDSNGCNNTFTINNGVFFTSCNDTSNASNGNGAPGILPPNDSSLIDTNNLSNPNAIKKFGICAPLTVYFMNPYDSTISWHWNFGDGDTSNIENPLHTYIDAGKYDVKLIVEYADNTTDTLIQKQLIFIRNVVADYAIKQIINCQEVNVNLYDSSINANRWYWNLGDGSTSTLQHPSHIYSAFDNYLISLKAIDTIGCSDILTKNIYIGTLPPIFTYNKTSCIYDTILFASNLSNIQSYLWNFGDGTTSTLSNPIHNYNISGIFPITLSVVDSNGCDTSYFLKDSVVVYQPIADFSIIGHSEGCNKLKISFENSSTDTDSWLWNFGDGNSSIIENPSHLYTGQGISSVSLTAYKGGCENTRILVDTVKVFKAEADFSFTQNSFCMPITANFTDLSTSAKSWLWNFSDGTTSTLQNPIHTYHQLPSGKVKLTITDNKGCTAIKQKLNINIFVPEFTVSAINGCIPLNIDFKDVSKGATSWLWNFGDGSTSTQQHPSHIYNDTGTYTITLIAQSPDGCVDTSIYQSLIKAENLIANFTSSSNLSDCAPLVVAFANQSTGATSWNWSFGDSSYSTHQNPTHIYNTPGKYSITLIVSNVNGCSDTIIKSNFIYVKGPVANFALSDTSGCLPLGVHFTDKSTNPLNRTWYFGDGDTSQITNPNHEFTKQGKYTVTLMIDDTVGCEAFAISVVTVYPIPQARYITNDTIGCEPYTATFINQSKNSTTYLWDFGDTQKSYSQNPSHQYKQSGTYNPYLIAFNSFGCRDTIQYHNIKVHPVIKADYIVDNLIGCAPASISFINNTVDDGSNSYHWDFGDGMTSNSRYPIANYNNEGLFDVSLIVTTSYSCSDTLVKPNYIQILDSYAPTPSLILMVTVISDNSTYLLWEPSVDANFGHYIVYRRNPQTAIYEKIATIEDVNNYRFMDTTVNTMKYPYCYKIQTVDRCGFSIDINELQEHCTINVVAQGKKENIEVNWTPYVGCNFDTYEIYRQKVGAQNIEYIASVPMKMLNYIDTFLPCPNEYAYRIKATQLCGNAISSKSNASMDKPEINIFLNQKVDIVRSTVVDNSSVLTEWKAPTVAPEKVVEYHLYRSTDNQKFNYLTSIPSLAHDYMDYNVDVQSENYYYQIKVINTCMIEAPKSTVSSSILLKVSADDNKSILYWTPYEKWEEGVEKYIIEKQDEYGNWKVIKVVDGKTNQFKDLILDE